ncbi:PspC domain-containing protein [Actinomadura rugatobispora]|uniref:PspC domain-containing protein n=1 Tax=Actinomadura rugatobispora TaxID=1994 RepID=A0ABW0ZYZ2_9ACTN
MADEQNTPRAEGPSRLARVTEGRVLAGVCTGLGRYTGIDPVVYRVGFAIMVLAHGQGILLYIAAALFMPAAPDRAALMEQVFRRRFDATGTLSILGALLCASMALSLMGNGVFQAGVPTDTIAVLTVTGLVLLTAHARGVDLGAAARSFPERLHGYPLEPKDPAAEGADSVVSLEKDSGPQGGGGSGGGGSGGGWSEGMIDLATLSRPRGPGPSGGGAAAAPPDGATAVPPEGAGRAPGGRVADPPAHKDRRHRAVLTSVTLLGAMAVAAATWPVAQTYPGPQWAMLVTASALAVVGCGLLMGGWFRARGLATMGTVLTCALLTSSVAAEAPRDARYGEVEWRPADAARTQQDYKIAAGSGRLDLTALPLRPGQRVHVTAEITFGELDVRVPRSARVEVDARVLLGDLDLAGRTISGPNARAEQVLEAEGAAAKNPPVIALRVRGRVSDVVVTRV